MLERGSRPGGLAMFLTVMLTLGLVGLTAYLGRWSGAGRNGHEGPRPQSEADTGDPSRRVPGHPPATSWADFVKRLQQTVLAWRRSTGPRRFVVDQLCLVPDVPSFFEAIATWDAKNYFPILIDDPAWTLPFLRAFRPSRVIRYAAVEEGRKVPLGRLKSPKSPADRLALWQAAMDAVARAWSEPIPSEGRFPPAGAPPWWLGRTPPGLVLSAPDSPMLAGAVALAAGRFQPMVRVEPGMWGLDDPGGANRFGDVLTLRQAWRFAHRLEARISSVTPLYDRLGDDCDFLTIAGDWPYRYRNDAERAPARGIMALDDLLGRELFGRPDARGLDVSRRRWAYTGRLLGDPAASVARAMGALFLQPSAALLWDTYDPEPQRSAYSLVPAADRIRRAANGSGEVVLRSGTGADLASWHRAVDPLNRFGFIWINSSGNPRRFSIHGGPGRPADLPGGLPTAVVMIHSFSAAELDDPQTVAGRWLAQGAFVYFGSVNEPFLQSFRPLQLVADLMNADVPLAAALRQDEAEIYGRPWRLIYLGDPLYRVRVGQAEAGRLSPSDWETLWPAYASWPIAVIAAAGADPAPVPDGPDDRLLEWCLDAAIAELAAARPPEGRIATIADSRPADWRAVLKRIDRGRLDWPSRRAYEDLLIDALRENGELEELQARLGSIPAGERGPRVWQAIEAGAMARLARMAHKGRSPADFAHVLDLWDGVIRLSWPDGSEFPAQLTKRVSAMVEADASRRMVDWLDRLNKAADEVAGRPGQSHVVSVVTAERDRIVARYGRGRE
jgi:hypothetical protein